MSKPELTMMRSSKPSERVPLILPRPTLPQPLSQRNRLSRSGPKTIRAATPSEKNFSDTTADDELNRVWAALSQRQRNRLRQAEREWIKQKDALPRDEQDDFTNGRTSYLRSFGGKN
jgi:Lysozyme inhibitor LprI